MKFTRNLMLMVIVFTCFWSDTQVAHAAVQIKQEQIILEGLFMIYRGDPSVLGVYTIQINLHRENKDGLGVEVYRYMKGDMKNTDFNSPVYQFKSLSINRRGIVFSTKPLRGISYSFAGQFIDDGSHIDPGQACTGQPVFEGIMNKFSKGKKIASATLGFGYACFGED